MQRLSPDILIIGAGIAGLWLHRTLAARGYRVLTLERHALGAGQTLAAQGIIHSGIKYGLSDILSPTAYALTDAPRRWSEALAGRGLVNLSGVAHTTTAQWLWPVDDAGQTTVTRLAKLANLDVIPAAEADRVGLLARQSAARSKPGSPDNASGGPGYRLDELVIDMPSLVGRFAELDGANQYRLNPLDATWTFHHNRVLSLEWHTPALHIAPRAVALCAGAGNEALLARWQRPGPAMQRRPLHMVMVRHPGLPTVNVHIINGGSHPRLTLTTHFDCEANGTRSPVWYLGGALAEEGIARTDQAQCEAARACLDACLPGLDRALLRSPAASWRTVRIDRAEPMQPDRSRPADAYCERLGNALIVWPTKLALAPMLADKAQQALSTLGIEPHSDQLDGSPAPALAASSLPHVLDWPKPPVGTPPWSFTI